MLRNILRLHPNLACPEETHFYRQASPFGSTEYVNFLKYNGTLIRHREMDKINEDEFGKLLSTSSTRRELIVQYMGLFAARNKPQATRWFEKTPQHFYGLPLLANDFPGARFIHIVRDPISVASSLKTATARSQGRVIGASVLEACNYWNEAAGIIRTLKLALGERLFEIRYEDFCADPQGGSSRILEFLDEPFDRIDGLPVREKSYSADPVLTAEEVAQVRNQCREGAAYYHYIIEPAAATVLTTPVT